MHYCATLALKIGSVMDSLRFIIAIIAPDCFIPEAQSHSEEPLHASAGLCSVRSGGTAASHQAADAIQLTTFAAIPTVKLFAAPLIN